MTRQPAPAAGFSADWLDQREPFDAAARDGAAPRLALDARLAACRPGAGEPLRVIDLACGTGANLRWLAPRLGGAQEWLVVDHDAALLRRWPGCLAARKGGIGGKGGTIGESGESGNGRDGSNGGTLQFSSTGFHAEIVRRRLDLSQALESLPWHSARLVTGSALLDLVSAAWLQRLVAVTATARVALMMALSVDGRHRWTPGDADDAAVAALFGAHQQRDKGFDGPALGAAAAPALLLALRRCGYRVHSARSDWLLDGRRDVQALALQRALIDGIAMAALEQAPASTALVQAWRQRRQALAPRSVLRIGHLDVLALPPH
ncbi:MAG: class I SAM-dependent methyltransferase [Betaproteobacteria bacterium]|nr:class I SAM-dependent methyltransferase [Betaproteobacteria bacterium]